ncbi:MAG: AMIN domain-containing protein [Thainema sp.]
MKQHLGFGSILAGAALITISTAQPAQAAPTIVTEIRVEQTDEGAELVLETDVGDRPQVFTINQGNSLTADVINTQLNLDSGEAGFQQQNPAPGIASVVVRPLDANSIRVVVTGAGTVPVGEVSQRDDDQLVFSFASSGEVAVEQPTPTPETTPTPTPTQPSADAGEQTAQVPPQNPDVLVPNPEVTINGVPVPAPQPQVVPPFLPRAVAPPVGDIAVSTFDTSFDEIDLGTDVRVPRLVLREAPAREVLSLLARAAGLNLAFTDATPTTAGGEGEAEGAGEGPAITLDIQDEPVQNVFNYVLRITGLEANRTGRTVFVGPQLPDAARDVATRTLRLNQVTADDAANFLATQGAESRQSFQERSIETLGEGAASRVVEVLEQPEIITVSIDDENRGISPLLLEGLAVGVDRRLNAVTLVGSPRKIEIASNLLTQLDLRQRQVAVNVKIVDVNLLNTEDFSTSFSFGIGDTYFSVDGGAATVGYGDYRPPTSTEFNNSLTGRPTIGNPFIEGVPFLGEGFFNRGDNDIPVADPSLGPDGSPLSPGISDFDPGEPATTEFEIVPTSVDPVTGEPTGFTIVPVVTPGEPDTYEFSPPSFFQYPRNFLARLQAQVVSGNAKILTDPTLIVQEGETASVVLAEQVITNVVTERTITDGNVFENVELELSNAGLTLNIIVDRIDDNGFITMQVNPEVTAPTATEEFGDVDVTLLAQRILNSGRVRLRDGQTLILSGIIQDTDRTTVSKVPILGDLPIIGSLFRSTNSENERREVIVLVTPQILDDTDQSVFGYGYTPGRNVQEILREQ